MLSRFLQLTGKGRISRSPGSRYRWRSVPRGSWNVLSMKSGRYSASVLTAWGHGDDAPRRRACCGPVTFPFPVFVTSPGAARHRCTVTSPARGTLPARIPMPPAELTALAMSLTGDTSVSHLLTAVTVGEEAVGKAENIAGHKVWWCEWMLGPLGTDQQRESTLIRESGRLSLTSVEQTHNTSSGSDERSGKAVLSREAGRPGLIVLATVLGLGKPAERSHGVSCPQDSMRDEYMPALRVPVWVWRHSLSRRLCTAIAQRRTATVRDGGRAPMNVGCRRRVAGRSASMTICRKLNGGYESAVLR